MYINPVVLGKRTLGLISCNTTTYRSLRPIPFQLSAFGVTPGLGLITKAIAPHWSPSYPNYLSPDQDKEEHQRVVWSRLHSHQAKLASRLSKQKEHYFALHQELNPRMTQVESSHGPLFHDIHASDLIKEYHRRKPLTQIKEKITQLEAAPSLSA